MAEGHLTGSTLTCSCTRAPVCTSWLVCVDDKVADSGGWQRRERERTNSVAAVEPKVDESMYQPVCGVPKWNRFIPQRIYKELFAKVP